MAAVRLFVVGENKESLIAYSTRVDKDIIFYAGLIPELLISTVKDETKVEVSTWEGEFETGWAWRYYTCTDPDYPSNGIWFVRKVKDPTKEVAMEFITALADGSIMGLGLDPKAILRICYGHRGIALLVKTGVEQFDTYIGNNGNRIEFPQWRKWHEYPRSGLPDF